MEVWKIIISLTYLWLVGPALIPFILFFVVNNFSFLAAFEDEESQYFDSEDVFPAIELWV